MNISAADIHRAGFEATQRTDTMAGTEPVVAKKSSSISQQNPLSPQDTVSISSEAREKSATSKSVVVDEGVEASTTTGSEKKVVGDKAGKAASGEVDAPEGKASVKIDDLKKQLQAKQNDAKSKKNAMDAAQALAGDDPVKQAEVKKLKNSYKTLEEEVSKLKAKVYSS